MDEYSHPALRPTRYHWAAGTNVLHWLPALGGWIATAATSVMAAGGAEWAGTASILCAIGAASWSGVWLLALPLNRRFQRALDARLHARYENDYDFQVLGLSRRIHPDLADRVSEVSRLRDKAREILTEKFGDHDPFAKDNLEKLDRLAISYLQLLASLSEYDEYLSLVDPSSIESDLEAARQAVETASTELRPARLRTVELLQNRLERYRRVQSSVELIKAQCKNLNATMKLLIDQAMTAADPRRVGRDIDQVLHNIRESEILSSDLAAFDDLEREVEDARLGELN